MGYAKTKTARAASPAEYSVYIYHHPGVLGEGSSPWERKNTTTESDHAVREARALYQSNTYPKVEIRKKFFDRRDRCAKEVAWKVYENKTENPTRILAISSIAIFCAVFAAAVLYLVVM